MQTAYRTCAVRGKMKRNARALLFGCYCHKGYIIPLEHAKDHKTRVFVKF